MVSAEIIEGQPISKNDLLAGFPDDGFTTVSLQTLSEKAEVICEEEHFLVLAVTEEVEITAQWAPPYNPASCGIGGGGTWVETNTYKIRVPLPSAAPESS